MVAFSKYAVNVFPTRFLAKNLTTILSDEFTVVAVTGTENR